MTDFIQEYLNSRNRRQYGSNPTIQSGPDGNTLSMGTFPGDIFGGSYPQMNQNETPQQMRQRISDAQQNTDLGNVFVGGARDAIQGAGETISELGNFVGLKIPPPRLPEVDKPEGTINNIARGFTQFGVGMLASPVKGFSLGKNIIRGAFSDSYFDPEEGGFVTFLREMGVGPEILEVLDTRVGEDATAIERLQGRLGNAVEGAVLGGIVDTLRYIKQTPHLLQKARETIIQAGKNAEARMAEGGATLMSGVDPDPLIAGAGKMLDNTRKRVGTTGQYIGGPPGLDNPQKLSALRKRINEIAIEAKDYRFWYERSGKQILEAVNGDVDEADKLIQAIAVTSPGTRVKGNLDFAVQAYYQHKAGLPIKTGRFPTAMSKKLQEIFDGKDWDGRKTDDFYNNLMVHIDPSRAGPVTVDLWMVRAFGYKTDMPSQKQYEFVTKETQRLAQKLGWEPQQVQASIWVAMKAKAEKTTLEEAGFDFADALQNNKAQISWESIPGRTGNHMPEMFDAPYEVQTNYHVDISKAFLDDDGRDIIAKRLGVISPGDFEAPGYFEGKVSPGTQTEIIAPKQYKGETYGEIEQGALDLINAYSVARGILLKQDAIGWHRPFYNPLKRDVNGIELSIGRDFTEKEIDSFAKILAELSGHGDYNPIGSRGGIRIINFDPEFDNKEFTKLVQSAIDKLKLNDDAVVKQEGFNSYNGYIGNDWSINKNGEEYTSSISTEGQSDILGKVRSIIDEIQPKVDEVEIYYAEKYGFTRNAELNTNVTKSDDGPSGGPTGQATGSNQKLDVSDEKGINVKSDIENNLSYADLIISGEKTYETRDTNSLKSFIGKRTSIVRTGEGEATAIGSVEIGEPIEVNAEEFRRLQNEHLVPEGSEFDIKEGQTKFLYPLNNPIKYQNERNVGQGRVSRKVKGIRAYSGSGADFKEFSIEKVGTGQGETNFGYGLYFDANEDVATFFRGEDGKTYKVNLNVKDTDLIDVETSFSQQPENVQNALRKYYDEYGISEDQPVSDLIASMPNNPASVNYSKTKEFAEDMNSKGIKGLRYKTLSHPTKETPSDTFVVFDDKVIEILEKYGIVGPVLLSTGLANQGAEDGNTN